MKKTIGQELDELVELALISKFFDKEGLGHKNTPIERKVQIIKDKKFEEFFKFRQNYPADELETLRQVALQFGYIPKILPELTPHPNDHAYD